MTPIHGEFSEFCRISSISEISMLVFFVDQNLDNMVISDVQWTFSGQSCMLLLDYLVCFAVQLCFYLMFDVQCCSVTWHCFICTQQPEVVAVFMLEMKQNSFLTDSPEGSTENCYLPKCGTQCQDHGFLWLKGH